MSATDLDDIRALMGPDWVRERLGDLAADLRTRFASTDNDSLARDAHALIGVAGMLGFGELSDLCRAVEVACRGGADVRLLRMRLKLERDRVLRDIVALGGAAPGSLGRQGSR